jgi:hypothetical protein
MDSESRQINGDSDEEERIDDWNLDFNFCAFAQHETLKIYSRHFTVGQADTTVPPFIEVECVRSLTPLDMISLGSGDNDATGHCVWMGAFLFIEGLTVLSEFFLGKNVVELGCGTGICSIALLRSRHAIPSYIFPTDADQNALELCMRNCKRNRIPSTSFKVAKLTWEDSILPELLDPIGDDSSMDSNHNVDIVFATDVLYDIGCLTHLIQTAVDCLTRSSSEKDCQIKAGTFVLSHVPRACYSSKHLPVTNLESYIVERSKDFGFVLKEIIRPNHLLRVDEAAAEFALNNLSLDEMDQVGAAILVFSLG